MFKNRTIDSSTMTVENLRKRVAEPIDAERVRREDAAFFGWLARWVEQVRKARAAQETKT